MGIKIMGIKTQFTRLENIDTGEIIDIWIDVSIEHHKGDNITPPETYYDVADWGEITTNNKPEWVTDKMLETKVYSFDLNDINDLEKDYDDYE